MTIAISGASGFIGRRLLKILAAGGHSLRVLSRHAGTNLPAGVRLFVWDPMQGAPARESLEGCDAIIHLAGEPVAQRWTAEAKFRIRQSRVGGTRYLVETLSSLASRPQALICASAVGYYGSRGDEILDESSPPGTGYLAEVCVEWEDAAQSAERLSLRVARVRIGPVLDRRGGALARLLPPFRWGVGGKLGAGTQWMSWIHLNDLAELFRFAVENPVRGVLNAVAPSPARNVEFTKELAAVLRRPALFPVPPFGLRVAFGEMAEVLLASQRVLPRATEDAGFRFRFPQIGAALQDLLR